MGAEVQVHSLTGEASMHYNHLRGELIRLDADRGRWNVLITRAAHGGKAQALKPGNLRYMLARHEHGCEEIRLAAPREDPRFHALKTARSCSCTRLLAHQSTTSVMAFSSAWIPPQGAGR